MTDGDEKGGGPVLLGRLSAEPDFSNRPVHHD